MLGLLPFELWDYRLSDALLSLPPLVRCRADYMSFSIPGLGDCIPARSARVALVAAIKALGLPPGARIGVPLYCCPVVFKSITAAGCCCRFVDVDLDTYCMSASDLEKKRDGIDAVVAVHMFGNMCDMSELARAAGGKPIIEDCAQSLGSMAGERPSGSFGSIAAFSFRSGKYLSVGEGGAIFAADKMLRERLLELVASMPTPGRKEELVHVAKTYIRSALRRKPLYGLIGYRVWSRYNRNVAFAEKSPIVFSQTFLSDYTLAARRLASIDAAIARQRANAACYQQTLDLDPSMLCFEKSGMYYNRYVYPLLFGSSRERDFVADYLHRARIGTAKPYSDIAATAALEYGYTGDCPTAEQIAQRVLAVPSHHGLREREVRRIAKCVNSGWAAIAGRGRLVS